MPEVCPWWLAYTFDNRLRRIFQKPEVILAPYIREGMTVVDIGAGMGYFAIPAARMIGDSGLVIAADLQQKMLEVLAKRARKAGVAERIQFHKCAADRIGIEGPVDLVLLCNVVHETPDQRAFLQEVWPTLRSGGKCFIAEPRAHVSPAKFEETVVLAGQVGFVVEKRPKVALSRAVVLAKR